MCPSTGPGVDPHSVSVCRTSGLWHGLSGAEEVHPQGPGCQVGGRELFKVDLIGFSSFEKVKTYFFIFLTFFVKPVFLSGIVLLVC